jgi:hypothetical protein
MLEELEKSAPLSTRDKVPRAGGEGGTILNIGGALTNRESRGARGHVEKRLVGAGTGRLDSIAERHRRHLVRSREGAIADAELLAVGQRPPHRQARSAVAGVGVEREDAVIGERTGGRHRGHVFEREPRPEADRRERRQSVASKSTWTGAVNSHWGNGVNRDPAGKPGAGSDVVITTRAPVASASIGTVYSITDSSYLRFESAGTSTVTTFVNNTGNLDVDASGGEGGTILNIGDTLTNSGSLRVGNTTLSAPDTVTAACPGVPTSD